MRNFPDTRKPKFIDIPLYYQGQLHQHVKNILLFQVTATKGGPRNQLLMLTPWILSRLRSLYLRIVSTLQRHLNTFI
jgi:hypothetical protein